MEAVQNDTGTETKGEAKHFVVKESSFDRNMIKLKEFKATYGHCDVPHGYKADPSFRLWCNTMRRIYKSIQRGEKPGQKNDGGNWVSVADQEAFI